MTKRILITGCQRSGTTLMGLILDSHPKISTIDEDAYSTNNLRFYLSHDNDIARAFKLPTRSADILTIQKVLKIDEVVWMIRDPRDVITSMANLKMIVSPLISASWILTHASIEINRMLQFFPYEFTAPLQEEIDEYLFISTIPAFIRKEHQNYKIAALCWKLKQCSLEYFKEKKVNCTVVRYEELATDPEQTLYYLTEKLNINFHNNLLKHHELHKGYSIGNTQNFTAINCNSIGKWKGFLSTTSISIINSMCSDTAAKYGYKLS